MSEIKVNSIKGVAASSAAITVNNTNGTCTANITNNLSNRNLIINGAMQVAQRGTSSTSEGVHTVDRFQFSYSGNDQIAFTQSQSTDSPNEFSYSYMVDIDTAESAVDANEYFQCTQRIEAQNLQRVKTNQVTLSFHVKAYQTGTYTVAIYQQDGNRLVTGTYTINSSATWEKKTITFPGNTGTQPDNNNGLGWEVAWILAAGSDFTSSNSTSWGGYTDAGYAYGQAVNVASSTDNYWKITGVQLEVGSVATDFEHKSIGQELALCQRYFYSMLDGQAVLCENATMYNSSNPFFSVPFPVTMRIAPSLEVSNNSGDFIKFENGGGTTFNTISRDSITSTRIGSMNASVSGTSQAACMIRGELSTAKVHWSAEL